MDNENKIEENACSFIIKDLNGDCLYSEAACDEDVELVIIDSFSGSKVKIIK